MARIVGAIGSSHVPSVGVAVDRGKMLTPEWKPVTDMFVPVREWLKRIDPTIAIIAYNDHGTDLFFDKYPTFAVGAADSYPQGDEGYGPRPLPPVRGDAEFSWHLCESLVWDEFDITVCQELAMDHGLLVPMNLCWDHRPDWPVKVVPLEINVLQHPLPTGRRCYRLGQALRRAVESYPGDERVLVIGTGGMSHQLNGERFGFMNDAWDRQFLDWIETEPERVAALTHHELMEKGGAESVELIMWLTMRGALGDKVKRIARDYYNPMTTGMAVLALENA
jgi:protocatechuate 4,5-dioxygenase beta chain